MKKKLSDHLFTMIAAAIILFAGFTYLKPETQENKPGYAFLDTLGDTRDGLTPHLDRKGPVEEIKPKEITPTELEERIAASKQPEEKTQQQQEKPKEEIKKETKKEEKPETKEETKKVVEEVVTEPKEEVVVMSNSQYIGNSGQVFMSYEEAESYAKKEAQECPDTIASYKIVPSWEHPIDGNRQFTVDFAYQS